jgi:hypothetical protein
MPQSFAIGPGALEDGNLEEIAQNTDILLRLVDLMQMQNRILLAMHLQASRMSGQYVDPLSIEVNNIGLSL